MKSHKFNFEEMRAKIVSKFKNMFNGKQPYNWQTDTCEALLLGLDTIVIAGTCAGKTFLFAMPLLLDPRCKVCISCRRRGHVVGDLHPYKCLQTVNKSLVT